VKQAAQLDTALPRWAERIVRSGCASARLSRLLAEHAADAEQLRAGGWAQISLLAQPEGAPGATGARPGVPRKGRDKAGKKRPKQAARPFFHSLAMANAFALRAAALAGEPLRSALRNGCLPTREVHRLRWVALSLALANRLNAAGPAAGGANITRMLELADSDVRTAPRSTAAASHAPEPSEAEPSEAGPRLWRASSEARAGADSDASWIGGARAWGEEARRSLDSQSIRGQSANGQSANGQSAEELLVFICVITAPHNHARRQQLRLAWMRSDGGAAQLTDGRGHAPVLASHAAYCQRESHGRSGAGGAASADGAKPVRAAACFFVGARTVGGEATALAPSDASAGDVAVLEGVADGQGAYRHLSAKVLAALRWASERVACAYVLKVDDDVFVHVPALVAQLQLRAAAESEAYVGAPRTSLADRQPRSNAYVSEADYAPRKWARFNQGIHYLLASPLARLLARGYADGRLRAPGQGHSNRGLRVAPPRHDLAERSADP
jgi:hypothetical protein